MSSSTPVEMQDLSKEVTVAREMAILGDYERSIAKFKQVFATITIQIRRYDVGPNSKLGGYANPTASSQQKKRKAGEEGGAAFTDAYLYEMWSEMKRALKNEYDQIVGLNSMLSRLDSADPASMFGGDQKSSSRMGARKHAAASQLLGQTAWSATATYVKHRKTRHCFYRF